MQKVIVSLIAAALVPFLAARAEEAAKPAPAKPAPVSKTFKVAADCKILSADKAITLADLKVGDKGGSFRTRDCWGICSDLFEGEGGGSVRLFMNDLPTILHHLQRQLFPALTAELGALSALDQQFCEVISLTNLGRFTRRYEWCGNGCPPCPRAWLAHAFIAKHVYQFPTTNALLDALKSRPLLRQLCGWDSPGEIPSEPTFSRAFAAFAHDQLPQQIHEHMVTTHAGTKLVGHISRDATAIEAPERPAAKPAPPAPAVPRKRGRPKQGDVRPPAPPKRLALQPTRTLAENLADLPTQCDVGCKRNSKGHQESWIGYKLHLDTVDGDFPVSAVLTSASVHDSQVAIPLAQLTAQRVTSLYDLMDSAYDAPQIDAFSRRLGHVPIIDPHPRGGEKLPFAPAAAQRFQQRSASERVNSLLKERYGGRWVRVRGAAKVMCHLMFGLVALTATALFARLC